MYIQWWILFSFNILLAAGIMLTYIGRRSQRGPFESEIPAPSFRTLVIVPAKGVDYGFDDNLISLKSQGYSNYELLAVVDSEEDPAVDVLKNVGVNYIKSMDVCDRCSGKVRAIYSALLKYPDFECYVVADSDILAGKTWLESLLKPLGDPSIGASTTFPIFYPEGGFWSKFKMFWGLVGQSMMESGLTRFVWGGSMAFRKELLDDDSLKEFSQSISDDISILRIVKRRGLKVSYVPEARPEIHSEDGFSSFMEWSNRQTAFSIYSTDRTFQFGMIYYVASIYLMVSSIVLGVFVDGLFFVFLFPYLFNTINSLRKVPVKVWYFPALTLILPYVYVWNLMSGVTRRRVVWRGNSYSLSRE